MLNCSLPQFTKYQTHTKYQAYVGSKTVTDFQLARTTPAEEAQSSRVSAVVAACQLPQRARLE